MSGRELPPTRSRSSRPRPGSRSTGACSQPGDSAASALPRSRTLPEYPRPEIRCSTDASRSTSPIVFPSGPRQPSRRLSREGGRIVAVGTTVVRALESAADADGGVRAGDGVAHGRIGRETRLRVVDAILTGVHQPGESHFELLRAFADDAVLDRMSAGLRGARLPRARVRRFHIDRTLLKAANAVDADRGGRSRSAASELALPEREF